MIVHPECPVIHHGCPRIFIGSVQCQPTHVILGIATFDQISASADGSVKCAVIAIEECHRTGPQLQLPRAFQDRHLEIFSVHIIDGSVTDDQIRPRPERPVYSRFCRAFIDIEVLKPVVGISEHHGSFALLADLLRPGELISIVLPKVS